MQITRRHPTRTQLVLAAASIAGLSACAGSLEGEVDGETVPPLISGYWLEGDGDGFQVSAAASTVLDVCGASAAMTREMTVRVLAKADEVDEGDDYQDVSDDLLDERDEIWQRHLPEDFWTVSASVLVEDDDDFVDDYDLGQDADIDLEHPAFATFAVCHQQGFPDIDDDGTDDNLTCYPAIGGELEVVSFDDQGTLALTIDAELADPEDLEDEVGEVTATTRMAGCAALEDASKDLADAYEDLSEALEPDDNDPPSEGEGEGEGEGEQTCSLDDDCLNGGRLCDIYYGTCVDPVLLTGTCSGAGYLSSRSAQGPVVFADSSQSTDSYCTYELTVTFRAFDADADIGSSPRIYGVDDEGMTLEIASVTSYGSEITAVVCLNSSTPSVALQVEDLAGNLSNALCTSP